MLHGEPAVAGKPRTCRNQLADNDVFFEAEKRIHFPFDCRFRKNSGGFLERSRREEGVCRQRGFRRAEKQVLTHRRFLSFIFQMFVHDAVSHNVHRLSRKPFGISGVIDFDLAEHLMDDDFNVLVIDFNTL